MKRINDRLAGDTYRCFITESVAKLHATHTHTHLYIYIYVVIDEEEGEEHRAACVSVSRRVLVGWRVRIELVNSSAGSNDITNLAQRCYDTSRVDPDAKVAARALA